MREADYRQAITQPTDVRAESASAVDQLVPPVVVTEIKISETSKSGGRAIQLDAVRGIAILAVLEFHFKTVPVHNALARGFEYIGKRIGWMGVDLFSSSAGSSSAVCSSKNCSPLMTSTFAVS